MSEVSGSIVTGRVVSNQPDLALEPRIRSAAKGRPPVIYCHSAGASCAEAVGGFQVSNVHRIVRAIARERFVVAATAPSLWGNATAIARTESVLAAAVASGASDEPPFIIGTSMGGAWACQYAKQHPVSGVLLFIPALDVEYLRSNDVNGLGSNIEGAWGSGPIDPSDVPVNFVLGVPTMVYAGAEDPISTNVEVFTAANDSDYTSVPGLGHDGGVIDALSTERFLDFIREVES